MTIGIIGGQRLLLAAMLASQENNQSQPIIFVKDMNSKKEIEREMEAKAWSRILDRHRPVPKSKNQKENEAKAAKNRAARRRRKSR